VERCLWHLSEKSLSLIVAAMSSILSPSAASFVPVSPAAVVQLQQCTKGYQQHWSDIVDYFLVVFSILVLFKNLFLLKEFLANIKGNLCWAVQNLLAYKKL